MIETIYKVIIRIAFIGGNRKSDKMEKYVVKLEGKIKVNPITTINYTISNAMDKMRPYDMFYKMAYVSVIATQCSEDMLSRAGTNKEQIDKCFTKDVRNIMAMFLTTIKDHKFNKYFRVAEIDSELVSLIENTDNKVFYRQSFIDSLFINQNFAFGNWIIRGIFVQDNNAEHSLCKVSSDYHGEHDNLMVCAMLYNKDTKKYSALFTDMYEKVDNTIEHKLITHVRMLICNILDMITYNFKEIEIRDSANTNKKQSQNNKIKVDKIFIRPNDSFNRYLKEFNNNCSKYSYRFLVRGHFRHYRSHRFSEELRNHPKWIKPYYKGSGIIIDKKYILRG